MCKQQVNSVYDFVMQEIFLVESGLGCAPRIYKEEECWVMVMLIITVTKI